MKDDKICRTCAHVDKMRNSYKKLGSEFSEWRDAGDSWRIVLKWNLERRGLNVAIELKWHALWNRCIKASLLTDGGGGGGDDDDDDALRINHEILVPWIQRLSWRLVCSGKWHCLLCYLITSVSEEPAACFFRVENKGSKCLHIIR
jgi:hypothetical protein